MKALVTGGGGFLGKAIVTALRARGDAVRTLARGDYPELTALGAEPMRGDIADAAVAAEACRAVDIVFHVAGKVGVWGDPLDFYLSNVVGTKYLLAACRLNKVRRFVFTSSPSVVHSGRDMEGVDESIPYPEHYSAPYAETKAEAERLVLAADGPDLSTVALRPHLIWGPGDNYLVPRIVERAKAGRLRRMTGPVTKVDSTYIDNAADAHLLAADRLAPGAACAGKAYFLSNGEPLPIWDLIDRILDAAGQPPLAKTISPRAAYVAGWVFERVHALLRLPGEPRMTTFLAEELATSHWFDISAARRDLGYEPKVSIEEGLRRLALSLK